MSQRTQILAQIWGMPGWVIDEVVFEAQGGQVVVPLARGPLPEATVVLKVRRSWQSRCGGCRAIGGRVHEQLPARRWDDLPWAGRRVVIEYAPVRVRCPRCGSRAVECLAWAEKQQRQSRRLQQHLALESASMSISHVALRYGLSWRTVRRAEQHALERWMFTRPAVALTKLGLDEKYLGRRNHFPEKFVTIVSNLDTGEPIWIGFGRSEVTVALFLATLSAEQKAALKLVASDMFAAFRNAIDADPELRHVVYVHDPFHIMKRVGEAVTEVRRSVFFRGGAEMRAVGRGTRWLVLRAWDRATQGQQAELRTLFRYNATLARAYQIQEEMRAVLKAPSGEAMQKGLRHVLRRTARRDNKPLRSLHESLLHHWLAIVALGQHRPPVGRIEALNNNWETLVRRGRGYRDLDGMLLKLRFMTANPLRTAQGTRRFVALGLPTPAVGTADA
jgi:transposase